MDSQKFVDNDNSWILVYRKYLDQYNQQQDQQKSFANGLSNRSSPVGSQRFIKESHQVLFNNAFNVMEAKRPVQNIYKRPI